MTSIAALRATNDWTSDLVAEADAAGNHDGTITVAELDGYLGASTDGVGALPATSTGLQLPASTGVRVRFGATAQGVAALRSRIAETTGEPDALRIRGPGVQLLRNYARTVYDGERRIPRIVGYVLAAADIREDGLERAENFRADKSIPSAQRAANSDYTGGDYDRGHMRPADDSPNEAAMRESFLLSNAAPQTPALNRQAWRQLELAVREAVRLSGGTAVIFTGNLFLDDQGKPLPPDQVRWIGRNRARRIAVPTHCFKAALIRLPNGQMTMVGFVLPNRDDLPARLADMGPLIRSARRSIADIERLAGETLFDDLPDGIERPMESAPNACLPLPEGAELHAVSLVFAEGCASQTWTAGAASGPTTLPNPEFSDDLAAWLASLDAR